MVTSFSSLPNSGQFCTFTFKVSFSGGNLSLGKICVLYGGKKNGKKKKEKRKKSKSKRRTKKMDREKMGRVPTLSPLNPQGSPPSNPPKESARAEPLWGPFEYNMLS